MGHPADVGHPRTVVQENKAAQITGYSVVPLGLDWLKLLTPGLRPGLHVLSPVGGWICELRCRSGCNRQCRYIGLTSVRLFRPSGTRRVENADPGLTPGATHFRRCGWAVCKYGCGVLRIDFLFTMLSSLAANR